MRPLPPPARSPRKFRVCVPVISQSGDVSPSPTPFTGSLLDTDSILVVGEESQASETETEITTGTISWFRVVITFGVADKLSIEGAIVSFTITVCVWVLTLP